MAWRAGFSPLPSLFALLIPPQIMYKRKEGPHRHVTAAVAAERKKEVVAFNRGEPMSHLAQKSCRATSVFHSKSVTHMWETIVEFEKCSTSSSYSFHASQHHVTTESVLSHYAIMQSCVAEFCSNTEALCTLTGCILYNLYCSTRYYTTRLLLFWHHLTNKKNQDNYNKLLCLL